MAAGESEMSMSKRNVKPQNAFAKADAALQANNRKIYPRYDDDVIRYGRPVADYNAGRLAANLQHARKQRKR